MIEIAASSAARTALTSALTEQRRAGRLPAASAAVARAGSVVWAAADGVAGPSGEAPGPGHAFRVGSITKTMVAVAVLRLAEDGWVALEDAVGRYLPDAPAPEATLAQLLSHTAGLAAEPEGPWWERAGGRTWAELRWHRALTPPGERFHYSNVGYAVLGRLVEQMHGQSWDAVVRASVWEPLGMTATAARPPGPSVVGYAVHPDADLVHAEPVADYAAMAPAGAVWSTPSDLVRFGSWLVAAGPDGAWDAAADEAAGGPDVLPLETRRRMCAPRVVRDEPGAPWTSAYGLGATVWDTARPAGGSPAAGRRRRTAGHGGSVPGFQAGLHADLTTGDVVAMCASSTAGGFDSVALLDVLDAHDPWSPASAGDAVDPELLRLTGTWYWGPAPYELRELRGGALELGADGGRGTVFARADGAWVGVEGGYWLGETLRPVEHEGRVVALDVGTFCFTRSPYDRQAPVPGGWDPQGWHVLPHPR